VDSSAKAKRDGFRKGAISTTAKNHRRNTLGSCVSSNVGSTEWKAHLKNGILVSGSATPPPCRLCRTGCPPSPSLPNRSIGSIRDLFPNDIPECVGYSGAKSQWQEQGILINATLEFQQLSGVLRLGKDLFIPP
jgi:hypothetical protein